MPYVNVKITKESQTTPEMKKRVIAGITQVLVDVLGKNPDTTFVLIEEVHTDDWGFKGTTTTELRAAKG